MSNFSRDPILLTPGPITTSLATKSAMLRDWGSWDAAFNAVTAEVRRKLLAVVHGEDTHVCVPLQGSGTFDAPSNASVTIINHTPVSLKISGITIPETNGGLYLNGVAVTTNAVINDSNGDFATEDNSSNAI